MLAMVRFCRHSSPRRLRAWGLVCAAAPTIPLWLARRRGAQPRAFSPQLTRCARGSTMFLLPALFTLPLLAAFYLRLLPAEVVQMANQWELPATVVIVAYYFLVGLAVLLWLGWHAGKRDSDAPRCPQCGYSLKGSPGPRCPECGSACEAIPPKVEQP